MIIRLKGCHAKSRSGGGVGAIGRGRGIERQKVDARDISVKDRVLTRVKGQVITVPREGEAVHDDLAGIDALRIRLERCIPDQIDGTREIDVRVPGGVLDKAADIILDIDGIIEIGEPGAFVNHAGP